MIKRANKKVAVEYGLFCLELGRFRLYFTATHMGMWAAG